MIYKAFLNRQEITGFPVKSKDINKIYGGDILLWEKGEQIKEPFTVEAYLPSKYGVINGNRFSIPVKLHDSTEYWILANRKKPYIDIKTTVGSYYDNRIQALGEIGGAICYLCSEKQNNTSLKITMSILNGESVITNSYIYSSDNSIKLVDATWLMNNHIFVYFSTYDDAIHKYELHIVLEFDLNGKIVEKYVKKTKREDMYKFPILEANFTTVKSGADHYCLYFKGSHMAMYKLAGNPFDSHEIKISSGTYIGSDNGRHFFLRKLTGSSSNAILYEFINGEFIEKRALEDSGILDINCCICKSHIYIGIYGTIYDYGDIDDKTEQPRKTIFKTPSAPRQTNFIHSQGNFLYVFHGTFSEKDKQYMTIIPL